MSSSVAVAAIRFEEVVPSSTNPGKIFLQKEKRSRLQILLSQGNYQIASLPDPSLKLKKTISVHLDHIDRGYVVSFDEANIGASGDSPFEALSNLGYLISDTWELLSEEKEKLGPGPARQLEVLQMFIGSS